jgi:hypothetical protein
MPDYQYTDKSFKNDFWTILLSWYKWPDKTAFVIIPRRCIITKKYYWFTKMKKGFSLTSGQDVYMHPKQFAIAKLKGWL